MVMSIIVRESTGEVVSMSSEAKRLCNSLFPYKDILSQRENVLGHFPIPQVRLWSDRSAVDSDGNRTVTLRTDPPLEEIEEKVDLAKYVMNSINQGVGLMLVNNNSVVFSSDRFRSLLNSVTSDIAAAADTEDRQRVSDFLARAKEGFSEIRFRLMQNGEERRLTRSAPLQYTETEQYVSLMVETVGDDIPSPETSASQCLNSFVTSIFDGRCFLDEDFRIVTEDIAMPRLRSLMLDDATNFNIKLQGRLLESFIPLEADKAKFSSEFLPRLRARRLEACPKDLMELTCETLRTRFITGENVLANVKLFVTPTFVDDVEPFNEETLKTHLPQGNEFPWILVKNAASHNPSKYLVGVRVLGKSSKSVAVSGDIVPPTPTDDSTGSTELSAFESSRRMRSSPSTLEQVPEHSETELSSESALNQARPPRTLSRYQTNLQALERCLTRDLIVSLSHIEIVVKSNSAKWLIPSYRVADRDVVQDELVRSVRKDLQYHFYQAIQKKEFNKCCNFLGDSNPLSPDLGDNMDSILCAFRFLVSLAPDLRCLAMLLESVPRVEEKIGTAAGEIARLTATLGLLSMATREPVLVATAAHLNALRQAFTEALKLRESTTFVRSQRLPTLYLICILWASLMQSLDRKGESVPVLENLSDDMTNYSQRHPLSASVAKLQAICWHNLAVSALENNDLVSAFNWIYKMQTLIGERKASLPEPCHELVDWAVATQSTVQKGEP